MFTRLTACLLTALGGLTACSSAAPPAPEAASSAAVATGRINPTMPAARLSPMITVSGVSTGALSYTDNAADALQLLPPAEREFALQLAQERQLPLNAIVAALRQAQRNDTVLRLMAPPARPTTGPVVRNWPAYRKRFVEPIRLRAGQAFWDEHAATLAEAEARYGVPAAVIVAILGVETVYGRNMGNFRVLDALYTLAFHWPEHARRDRSPYFRSELGEYLTFALKQGRDPGYYRGSFAGAIGMPQFMPGSIRNFAVATQPGRMPDLIGNPRDVIFSVANYLREHGWRSEVPVFINAQLPIAARYLADGSLEPKLDWQQLQNVGITVQQGAMAGLISGPLPTPAPDLRFGLINLERPGGPAEYRLATPNFFAITHYNRSYFYAAAVADLAHELQVARRSRLAQNGR